MCLVELGDFILNLFTESTHQAQASRTRGGIHTAPPPHFLEYAFCYSKISFPLDAGMLNRQVAPPPPTYERLLCCYRVHIHATIFLCIMH